MEVEPEAARKVLSIINDKARQIFAEDGACHPCVMRIDEDMDVVDVTSIGDMMDDKDKAAAFMKTAAAIPGTAGIAMVSECYSYRKELEPSDYAISPGQAFKNGDPNAYEAVMVLVHLRGPITVVATNEIVRDGAQANLKEPDITTLTSEDQSNSRFSNPYRN